MNLSTPSQNLGTAPADGASSALTVHTAIVALRCWWHLALPIGVVSAAGVVAALYFLSPSQYTAQAWLYVREDRPVLVTTTIQEEPKKFRANQIELIKSPPILGPVTSLPSVAGTPELKKASDPVAYLREHLKVKTLGESDYYLIEFTSESAEKAKEVVNGVADEYYRLSEKHEAKLTQDTIAKLIEHQVDQQQHVENLRSRVEKLAKEAGDPDIGITGFRPQRVTEVQSPAAGIRSRLLAKQLELAVKSAELDACTRLSQEETFEPSESDIHAQVERIPLVVAFRERLSADQHKAMEYSQKIQKPANAAGKHAASAELAARERQIRDSVTEFERHLVELRKEAKVTLEQEARRRRQQELNAMASEKQRLEIEVKVLQSQLAGETQIHKEHVGNTTQLEFAKAEFEMSYQFLRMISERIMKMQTERQAPERIQIFQYATKPSEPSSLSRFKKIGMAGCMALFAPLGLAVAYEVFHRRVSSRTQLESAPRLSVVGEVTTLPARVKRRSAGYNYERQLFEESVDGLRTYLSLADAIDSRKVLAVTSAVSREGKTSLSSQLAVSISSATRRPTLLIDGDMRSPDIHRIFGVDLAPGLSEVLRGECSVSEVIETGFSEHLHILTAGNLNTSPHRLIAGGHFNEVLAQLRSSYDFIVLDTPPILAASESLVMAKAADSAILCARRDFSRIDQVVHAFTRLKESGVQPVGTVLNGVPARRYSYRYGNYYYTQPNDLASPTA